MAVSKLEKRIRELAVCVLFPVIASYVVYFGFNTNYTRGVFHEEGFRRQYESGIYKYRILGRYAFLMVVEFVENNSFVSEKMLTLCGGVPEPVTVMDEDCTSPYYLTYFLVNTIFLVVTSILLYIIFKAGTSSHGCVLTLFLTSAIALSQYVVSPYDTISYALLSGAILLILRPMKRNTLWLAVLLALATLVRESSALILSFYFAHNHNKVRNRDRKAISELIILSLEYILIYACLRLVLGTENALVQHVHIESNLTWPRSLMGLLALLTISYISVSGCQKKTASVFFLFAALPYIIITLIAADVWEIRLWIPVWMGLYSAQYGQPQRY